MSAEELKRERARAQKRTGELREREKERERERELRERERERESNGFARGIVHALYRFLFVPCLRLFLLSTHSFTQIVLLIYQN